MWHILPAIDFTGTWENPLILIKLQGTDEKSGDFFMDRLRFSRSTSPRNTHFTMSFLAID